MCARRLEKTLRLLWLPLLLVAAACGGGSSSDPEPTPPVVVETNGPGRLESASQLGRVTVDDILTVVRAPGSRVATLTPIHEVTNHRVTYLTTDAQGQQIVASALVSVPMKAAGAASPVLAYQHATIDKDAKAPSNNATAEEAAVVLASLGYIVVAADYVGYGASKGTPHPYLLSAPSAAAVVDLLTAAATWRQRNGVVDNGQLFLIGYSEGAYVTVAAQRAMQASGSPHQASLVAVAAGAGPYQVGVTLDELLRRAREELPALGALIRPGFLSLLSDSARRELRDALLKQVLAADTDVVFDGAFIDNYLADNRAAIERQSNVHDWAPAKPLILFHGREDQTVPYASATETVQAMRARGAPTVSLTDCAVVPSRHIECVPAFLGFALGQFATRARGL